MPRTIASLHSMVGYRRFPTPLGKRLAKIGRRFKRVQPACHERSRDSPLARMPPRATPPGGPGKVLEPAGQQVEIQVIQRGGEIFLIHCCYIATNAEIDFIERAGFLYLSRNPSSASVKAGLITLSIGRRELKGAHSSGILVLVDGVMPPEDASNSKKSARAGFRPRNPLPPSKSSALLLSSPSLSSSSAKISSLPPPPTTTSSASSSPFSSERSTPREHQLNTIDSETPPATPSTPALLSAVAATPSALPASKSLTSFGGLPWTPSPIVRAPTPDHDCTAPSEDVSYLLLDWEVFLLGAGLDGSAAKQNGELLARQGIAVPADPRKLPWRKIKESSGVRLGHLQKIRKHVEAKFGPIPPVADE